MSQNAYETGRLNLPFVGHCTFGKQPICTDWDNINADVAVLGVPYDMGTQYRSGARFGPRAIREASTLFSFGHGGAYDFEDDVVYLPTDRVRIVSTYLSHAVYRGVLRGRIQAAPTDSPVLQGRLAVEMAVRALEGRLTVVHAGPPIRIVTPETVGVAVIEGSLAPASFVPVFSQEAPAPAVPGP